MLKIYIFIEIKTTIEIKTQGEGMAAFPHYWAGFCLRSVCTDQMFFLLQQDSAESYLIACSHPASCLLQGKNQDRELGFNVVNKDLLKRPVHIPYCALKVEMT